MKNNIHSLFYEFPVFLQYSFLMTACALYHGSIALIFYHNKKLAPANFGTNESTTASPAVNEGVTTAQGIITIHFFNKKMQTIKVFCFFGYENFGNFIFWPKLSPTCTESVVRSSDDAIKETKLLGCR